MPIKCSDSERGGAKTEPEKIRAGATEAALVVHCPPDFYVNAEILGVCALSEENASKSKYGWVLDDFLKWKTLFYGFGDQPQQTWLSTLDISEVLKRSDMDQTAVHEVVGEKHDQVTKITGWSCGFELKRYISESAQKANERESGLVIMFFAPVTPELDICLDLDGVNKSYMTMDNIREIVRDSVKHSELPLMVMTPSPFTGGWMCNPALFGHPISPSPKQTMDLIARSCGAAFANEFMELCTKRSNPFLTDKERSVLPYEDPMPIQPTESQLTFLHRLQEEIYQVMAHRFYPLSKIHEFDFNPHSESWLTYRPRRNLSIIDYWARKWKSNKAEGDEIQEITLPDRFEFLGPTLGGCRETQIFHLKYLATIELQTCPGDWHRPASNFTKQLLSSFIMDTNPTEKDVKHVYACIEYRASSMMLAQILAKGLELPSLKNPGCRFWKDAETDQQSYRKFQVAFSDVLNLFDQMSAPPGEKRHDFKSVRFWRPARWLSAAIALKFENGSDDDIKRFIAAEVKPFVLEIRQRQLAMIAKDGFLERLNLDWLDSIGVSTESGSGILSPASSHQSSLDLTEAGPSSHNVPGESCKQPPENLVGGFVAKPFDFRPSKPIPIKNPTKRVMDTSSEETTDDSSEEKTNEPHDDTTYMPFEMEMDEPTEKPIEMLIESKEVDNSSSAQTSLDPISTLVNPGVSTASLDAAEIAQLLMSASPGERVRLLEMLLEAAKEEEAAKKSTTAEADTTQATSTPSDEAGHNVSAEFTGDSKVTPTGTPAVEESLESTTGESFAVVPETSAEHERLGYDDANVSADNPAVALNPTPPSSPSNAGLAGSSRTGDDGTEGKSETLTEPESRLFEGEDFWAMVGW
ncbi:hypothetical protein B0T19DRAFT_471494 [Cercophora scortea]|uniref:Uncharacterized protein n=1 Tax=Cercophora scortea TaxID=314031 RepID=A0AAE0ML16_9PEZI|nr:hypothetical protein B0T19DRAFT_471494 [Cercophora scortea]